MKKWVLERKWWIATGLLIPVLIPTSLGMFAAITEVYFGW